MNVGGVLTHGGAVTAVERRKHYGLVEAAVNPTTLNGVVCAPGKATVVLPYRGGPAVPHPFVPE